MLKPSVYQPLTLILLFFISFIIRLIALYQTNFANGWDGYYYIMQMYTFIENGVMRAPDYSIIYSFYIGLYYLLGEYILAYKVGSAIIAATFTLTLYFFSFYLLTYKQTNEKQRLKAYHISLTIAAFSLFSPTLTYFTAQFPKNLLGLLFLLWFVYFFNKKSVFCLVLFFALSFFTHRVSALLALLILLYGLLKEKHAWVLLGAISIGVVGAVLLPGIIHFADLARFKQVFELNFPLLELINYFGTDRISTFWLMELTVLFVVFISLVILLTYRYLTGIELSRVYIQLFLLLIILSLPIFTFKNAGLGFRLYLSFNVFALLLLTKVLIRLPKKLLVLLCLLLTGFSFFSYQSYNPKTLDPPYDDYFHTVEALKKQDLKNKHLIIAHQGLAQLIIIYTDANATNWRPLDTSKLKITYRIAANIPYYYFNKYLNSNELKEVHHLYKSYCLMPDLIWQQFSENVYKSDNNGLKAKLTEWYNPSKSKPQFMLKGRKKEYIH